MRRRVGPQTGLLRLRNAVMAKYAVGNMGIYAKRKIRGGIRPSVHSQGRAWDAACDATDPSGLLIGNEVRDMLIEHARELGIEKIIWNQEVWTPQKGFQLYGGLVPHIDHLHIEMSWLRAADRPLPLKQVKEILNAHREIKQQ